jgi:hypothetical protein
MSNNPFLQYLPEGTQNQATMAGLGALAQALLRGGAPTLTPGGGIAAMGEGLGGFGQAYNARINSGLSQAATGMQLAEMQRKQKAQADLAESLKGVSTPVQVANAGQPGAVSMAARMNGNAPAAYQEAMASPKAQAALMELYGPAGMAAIRSLNAPIAVGAEQGLYVPGQGWVLKPNAAPKTDIGKLIAERDKLAPNSPEYAAYQGAIQKAISEGGFQYGPNGAVPVAGGPADPKYIGAKAGAEAAAQAPYKVVPYQSGGGLAMPFANGLPGGTPPTGTGAASPQLPPQFTFSSTPGGGIVMRDTGPQQATVGKIEEKLLNSSDQLGRLTAITQSFKPEYLQIGTRAGVAWSAVKEKLGGNLDQADRSQLRDFTNFKRDAMSNVNRTLNELSGAAVNEHEAKRIMAELPNPGQGLFDGDAPTEFKSKLDGATNSLRNAILRYNFAKSNGLNPLSSGIALDEVPALVEKRGAAIEEAVKKAMPNAEPEIVRMEVRMRLGREFGMTR